MDLTEEKKDKIVKYLIDNSHKEIYLQPEVVYKDITFDKQPISRLAFIETYGQDNVLVCESTAIIRSAKEAYIKHNGTKWYENSLIADREKQPKLGSFIWGIESGLKQDSGRGLYSAIEDCIMYGESDNKRLLYVNSIVEVDNKTMDNPKLADDIVEKLKPECYSMSDDKDKVNVGDDNYYKYFYTIGCAVISEDGRWFFIDSEMFTYARYIYLPLSYREQYPNIVQAARIEKKIEDLQKQVSSAELKVEYYEKCSYWESVLQLNEVKPYIEKTKELFKKYQESDTRKLKDRDNPAYLAYNRAKQEELRVRKANVLAMCNYSFPNIKFKIKINNGWGSTHDLIWNDGPTEKEFMEKVDLNLFCTHHTTWNGMEDCTEHTYEKYCDFAHKYFDDRADIDIKRYTKREY